MKNKILALISTVIMGAAILVAPVMASDKVTICHAAGLDGTTKYVTITISENAVYGPGGHFNENGTPQAGHEEDYLGPCLTSTPVPSASSTITPSPTPANSGTPMPSVSPSPSPVSTATPSPTPRPTPDRTDPVATIRPLPTPTPSVSVTLPPTDTES